MRIYEIEEKPPVIRMTKRFGKDFAEFARAFPNLEQTFEEFLAAKQADWRAPFGKKDILSTTRLLRGWWHCHLFYGKAIVMYRASADAIEIARLVDHLSVEGVGERIRALDAYLKSLGSDDFQDMPRPEQDPGPDLNATRRAAMMLFYDMAAHKDDRKMLDAFVRGTSDDALEFLAVADPPISADDVPTDTLRNWAREALHHIPLAESALPPEFRPIRNPSKTAVFAALRRTKAGSSEGLRGLIAQNGDLFVWDGYYANHDEAERELGLGQTISIHLYTSYPELDADNLDEDEISDACRLVISNPHMQRIYGPNFDFQVEIGYDMKWASAFLSQTERRVDEVRTPRFTAQQIDAAIKAATKNGKRHYGFGGNCAIFAVTLNKVLGGIGTCVYVDSEDSYEYVDHVALRVDGHYFDCGGLVSENALKQYGIGDTYEDEDEVEIHEVDDESVLSMVDGTGGGMSSPLNPKALEADLRAALRVSVTESSLSRIGT